MAKTHKKEADKRKNADNHGRLSNKEFNRKWKSFQKQKEEANIWLTVKD